MHMNFSEDAEHNYFFSQPHQPFFVLAFINALVAMFIFMLSYNGSIQISISASNFHAYAFAYLLFTPAFFGFLFTTFPRFSSTPSIEKKVYIRIFSFFYIGSTLYLLGNIVSPFLSTIGMVVLFIGHLLGFMVLKKIYTTSTMEDKQDIFWILIAMLSGLFAHLFFIVGQLWYAPLVKYSTEISIYLYLFFLAFTVAQRMVPFFSHCMITKNVYLLRTLFILLMLHILIEAFITNGSFIIDTLIGILLAREIKRWKLPFPNPNPLLWILHIALFWTAIAFICAGMLNFITLVSDISFLAFDIHALMLGFVLTILIGFGTRVTLGHSGNMMKADRYTTLLFYWTQVIVIVRLLTSFVSAFGWDFMPMFNLSAIVWMILFIAWALRFFPVLINGKRLTD